MTHHFILCPFFFNAPPPTEIYTLSLHDALPISWMQLRQARTACGSEESDPPFPFPPRGKAGAGKVPPTPRDRKSTRLNSSHRCISYAVFCLKKKKKKDKHTKYIDITHIQNLDPH